MSKISDATMNHAAEATTDVAASRVTDTGELGLQPFNARSIALSVLLGTHPPELPASALVSLAGLFGIAAGTMRTALSRLVAGGELTLHDARYRLTGRLLERQTAQDTGRVSGRVVWDGSWHTITAVDDQRDLPVRRAFRRTMINHRFGELRPDIWIRPTNGAMPTPDDRWVAMTGPLSGIDAADLAQRLWDLPALAGRAAWLGDSMTDLRRRLDWTEPASIPQIFTTSAAVVRFLRTEPRLPPELLPTDWPGDRLRSAYDAVERDFQPLLRSFLASHDVS